MSKRKKGYLELVIVAIIFYTIYFYFNLPKEILIVFWFSVILNLIIFEFIWRFQED